VLYAQNMITNSSSNQSVTEEEINIKVVFEVNKMQLTFNPSLLCVLAFISRRPSCLVQLATSQPQSQEHAEIQFCKLQDPAWLYPINCIY
jgi:hypothetical protein